MVTTEQIKELRDQTGVSIMECKKALEEADGDIQKASILLRKKSSLTAKKKSDRQLGGGVVSAYIHANGSIGAMIQLSCETDFVAKNDEFKALAYDIAMQIAATNPSCISRKDVSDEELKILKDALIGEVPPDKSEDIREKILEGKLNDALKEKVLLEQSFIKDESDTIGVLLERAVQKFGERIEVTKFERMSL